MPRSGSLEFSVHFGGVRIKVAGGDVDNNGDSRVLMLSTDQAMTLATKLFGAADAREKLLAMNFADQKPERTRIEVDALTPNEAREVLGKTPLPTATEQASVSQFNLGDVVRLKCGSPKLTIIGFAGAWVRVGYFAGPTRDNYLERQIPSGALEIVSEKGAA